MTLTFPWSYPMQVYGGLPLFAIVTLVVGSLSVLYGVCTGFLAGLMPKSGGDYVFTSRILHPALGWIEAMMTVFAILILAGYNVWAAATGFGSILYQGAGVYGASSGLMSLAAFLTQSTSWLVIGIVLLLIAAVMSFMPTKIWSTVYAWLILLSCVATLVLALAVLSASPAAFSANFQRFSGGMSQSDLVTTATGLGFSRDMNPLNAVTFLSLFMFTMGNTFGYTFTGYLGGEIRGDVGKTVLKAVVGGCFVIVIIVGIGNFAYWHTAGYDFLNAWSYLVATAPTKAPYGIEPTSNLVAGIARPDLFVPLLVCGFFAMVMFNFLVLPAYIVTASRILFAGTMDRLLPTALAKVESRTHAPLYMTAFSVVAMFISFFLIYFGVSPISTLWFYLLMAFPVFAFPALSSIILPYRRKELYQLATGVWRRKFLGLPFPAIIGAIWLIFFIPIYVGSALVPIAQSLWGVPFSQAVSYGTSSGTVTVIVTVIVAIVWYFGAAYYHKRHGLDISLVFVQVPPD